MQENILKSVDYESEATGNRYPYLVKKYNTEGKNVPLKKDWSESWTILPANYDLCLKEILNFDVQKDDVFLATFMKSGTTWMQESAWLLLNNLDFEKSEREDIMKRSPFLELQGFNTDAPGPSELAKELPSPRLLKTHLPAHLVPSQIWKKKQKTIYVARNVKDVIVSSYHFMKNTNLWTGTTLPEYVEDFIGNEIIFTPYWSHVLDFWFMRHEPFIFFTTYEEMARDLAGILQKLCKFIGRPQLSQEELEKTVEYLSFDNMKKNKTTNLTDQLKEFLYEIKEDFEFMRRGIVGSFNDELTPDLIAKIDNWTVGALSQYGLKEEDIFGKLLCP